jgi:hypothetical protein
MNNHIISEDHKNKIKERAYQIYLETGNHDANANYYEAEKQIASEENLPINQYKQLRLRQRDPMFKNINLPADVPLVHTIAEFNKLQLAWLLDSVNLLYYNAQQLKDMLENKPIVILRNNVYSNYDMLYCKQCDKYGFDQMGLNFLCSHMTRHSRHLVIRFDKKWRAIFVNKKGIPVLHPLANARAMDEDTKAFKRSNKRLQSFGGKYMTFKQYLDWQKWVTARNRIMEICVAFQSLELPVLVILLIVDEIEVVPVNMDFGQWHSLKSEPMHKKWNIITKVKHFTQSRNT